MRFLVDHPAIKWVMAIVAIVGIILGYKWHIEDVQLAVMESMWLELDKEWNADIISSLKRIEAKLEDLAVQ